jgi:mannose-6-phosphate isomerase-like protein (cupin superfamily)
VEVTRAAEVTPMFANRSEIVSQERPDGVDIRRLMHSADLELTEYTVPRGFATGPSDHDQSDKTGYVVSGVVEILTDAESVTLTAGGAYLIPRGVPHQFIVREDAIIVQVRVSAEST